MPAIKKPEHMKLGGAKVLVHLPKSLKADVDAMSEDTGISTSERVRSCLESQVKKWKAGKPLT